MNVRNVISSWYCLPTNILMHSKLSYLYSKISFFLCILLPIEINKCIWLCARVTNGVGIQKGFYTRLKELHAFI